MSANDAGSQAGPRCFGDKPGQALYAAYHDQEWGVPEHDDRKLFEMLVLEGAQAGLSWETVLRKREGYRRLFHGFDPGRVAAMSDAELEGLLADDAIIRNRLKVFAARRNARAFLEIQSAFGTFDAYVWDFVDGQPVINRWDRAEQVPSQTTVSERLSRDLRRRDMRFVGPTICYAYMQAVGMVNDHLTWCWRHGA
jgi:DNA-3-methyladenine glycosylase I